MKPRFAVDLDEVERQLNYAPGQPVRQPAPAPAASGRNDPLAELARIVGQEDPFGSMLATDKAARPGPAKAFDDIFAPRADQMRPTAPAPAYQEPAAYRPVAAQPDYAAEASFEPAPMAYQPVSTAHQSAPAAQEQDDDRYEADYDRGYDQEQDDDRSESAYQAPARRSRKGLIAVASVLGAAVLGAGAALTMGGKGSPVGGEPPLVMASAEPVKVQPQSPGGVEIPNQNKQIYERATPDAQTKMVNREEQPIDVRQATRMVPSPESTATTAQPGSGLAGLGEPRRVRTVSIRPDGTAVGGGDPRPAATATASAAAPMAMTLPPAAQATPATPVAAAPRLPAPMPATPAATTPVAPRPVAATPAAPTSGASPQSVAPAAPTPAQPAPQRVASVAPTALAAPAPAAASESMTGGFAVQLAVGTSEADARKAFQQLQQKHADLNGRAPMIRKAEVNGNTIFRVRVGPLSKDDASSLCSKLQGAGGQCFVAKN